MIGPHCLAWALNHAPTASAHERAVLAALAVTASPEGDDALGDRERLARAAHLRLEDLDPVLSSLEGRGLIQRVRVSRWDVLAPASYWSAAQLADINERRDDTDLITSETRPDLPERR